MSIFTHQSTGATTSAEDNTAVLPLTADEENPNWVAIAMPTTPVKFLARKIGTGAFVGVCVALLSQKQKRGVDTL